MKLEDTINPVFNPNGPDLEDTKDLVRVLSLEVSSDRLSSQAKLYTENLIAAIKKGYEIQSGKEYPKINTV